MSWQPVVNAVVAVIIYLRISESDMADTPEADRQEYEIRQMLDHRYGPDGWRLVARLYDHDKSAWDADVVRPDYDRCLAMCRAGAADMVAVWDTVRFYRRTDSLSDVIDALGDDPATGVGLVTVQDGPVDLSTSSGRMVARVLAAVGQHESDLKSERILSQLAQAMREGWAPPQACYGYRYRSFGAKLGGTFDQVGPEAAAVLRAVELLLEDGLSLGDVAERLNEEDHPRTKANQGPWTKNTLRKLLASPSLAGFGTYWPGGQRRCRRAGVEPVLYEGNWTPIIEPAVWHQVRDELVDPERRHKRKRGTYWLRGVLFDAAGVEMTGHRCYQGDKARRAYASLGACGTTIDADAIEGFLTAAVAAHLDVLALPGDGPTVPTAGELAVRALNDELVALAADKAERAGTPDAMTQEEWRAARAVLVRRLETVKAEQATTRPARGPSVRAADVATRWKLPPERGGLSPAERQRLVRWAVGRVTVAKSRGGRYSARWDKLAQRLTLDPEAPLGDAAGPEGPPVPPPPTDAGADPAPPPTPRQPRAPRDPS